MESGQDLMTRQQRLPGGFLLTLLMKMSFGTSMNTVNMEYVHYVNQAKTGLARLAT